MDRDKWISIQSKMTTGLETKYAEVSIDEEDLSVLTNTYELQQQNQAVISHLQTWDMDHVFQIVGSADANNPDDYASLGNLLTGWPNISIDQVAKSNEFYHLQFEGVASYCHQNLELSHAFTLDSCDPEMKKQVNDSLLKFEPHQWGGPLTLSH